MAITNGHLPSSVRMDGAFGRAQIWIDVSSSSSQVPLKVNLCKMNEIV
jgi:hypothetical protein